MPISQIIKEQVFDLIKTKFKKEMEYFANAKVAETPYAVIASNDESWTQYLFAEGIIATSLQNNGRFVELERVIVGLAAALMLNLPIEQAYESFIEAQKNNPEIPVENILCFDRFKRIYELNNIIIGNNNDMRNVLLYLLIYSDLGKSSTFKDALIAKQFSINVNQDPDDLMTEILSKLSDAQIIEVLPSFGLASFSPAARKLFREIYPLMRACIGHIYFLERGQKTFDMISEALLNVPTLKRETATKLVFLAQYFDGIGAQGQGNIHGSLTCTEGFAKTYHLIYNKLEKMCFILADSYLPADANEAARRAFKSYLDERTDWLGLTRMADQQQREAIVRMGCGVRGMTEEWGRMTQQTYLSLPKPIQAVVASQISFAPTGFEAFTKTNYFATMPFNQAFEAFKRRDIPTAIRQAVDAYACIAMITQHIGNEFKGLVTNPQLTLSLAELASLAHPKNKERIYFDPTKLDPTDFYVEAATNKVMPVKLEVSKSLRFMLLTPPQVAVVESVSNDDVKVAARMR